MIGQRLKLARAAAGLSLQELQGMVATHIPPQALAQYENDERMPGSAALLVLARALNVSAAFLLSPNEVTILDD